jgi:hypothetical protein
VEDETLDLTISRRRFLGGIGTAAAGVTAVAALGTRLRTSTDPARGNAVPQAVVEVPVASRYAYDLQRAGSYIAQQRGNVPLSPRGSRATTLH